MFIPRYWASVEKNVQNYHLIRWGYSNTSEADAIAVAEQRIAHAVANLLSKDRLSGTEYPYGVLPAREEIIEEIQDASGELQAIITRNSYGSMVLNTDRLMFIDVDLDNLKFSNWISAVKSFWRSWFTSSATRFRERQEDSLTLLQTWLKDRPDWQVRVYRTKAGLRYLVSRPSLAPGCNESEDAMRELGCDPRYIQLCRVQHCYRARLTPKPWRAGLNRPLFSYPWISQTAEQGMRTWEMKYANAIQKFATCELLTTFGSRETPVQVAALVELHDRLTKVDSLLPLA